MVLGFVCYIKMMMKPFLNDKLSICLTNLERKKNVKAILMCGLVHKKEIKDFMPLPCLVP